MPAQKLVRRPVAPYLRRLPKDRAILVRQLRRVILRNLPAGYSERYDSGMIRYEIPLTAYPNTYNGRPLCVAALASRKAHVTLYLMAVYGDEATAKWFRRAFLKSGKKLHMGGSCVHFRRPEDVPFDVVGKAIARTPPGPYIRIYERARRHTRPGS